MPKEKISKKDEKKSFMECTDEWLKLSSMGKQRYEKIHDLEIEALTRKLDLELENGTSKKRDYPMKGYTRFMKCCYKRKGLDPDLIKNTGVIRRLITDDRKEKTD